MPGYRIVLTLFLLIAVICSARYIDAQTSPISGLIAVAVNGGAGGPPSLFPDGTKALPSISFQSSPTVGFSNLSGSVVVSTGGAAQMRFQSNQIAIVSGAVITWSTGDPTVSGSDVGIARKSAGLVEVNNASAGTVASFTTNNVGVAGGAIILGAASFSTLNVDIPKGALMYCVDCAPASAVDQTCVGASTGSLAFRVNGLWKCIS